MKWQRNTGTGEYISGQYRIRRFKSGLRGDTTEWFLYRHGEKVRNRLTQRGGWLSLRDAKEQAANHQDGVR